MASTKFHSDQENVVPDLRQKQANVMAAQTKRQVLGAITGNTRKAEQKTEKQALKPTGLSKRVDEKQKHVEHMQKVVVPVAQFQAFSVYEDEDYKARVDRKLRQLTELAEIEDREKLRDTADEEDDDAELRMSIEKIGNEENDGQLAEQIILQNRTVRDIFFECEEYRDEIYAYLLEHELRHRPKPGYIVKQPDVTENMRSILVDWLVEVTQEYNMQTETLYLAVNFIDRFLSYMSVVRAKLQLVGTAAMFIAAKYEEILPPNVSEFVYITADTYDKSQVIRMEHLILRVLGFDLSIPTPLTFINAICIAAKLTEKTMYLAMYLSEISLLEVEPYLQFLPSVIACSAIALSRHTQEMEPWTQILVKKSGYKLQHLKPCIEFLRSMQAKAPRHAQHAIPDKYKTAQYMHVSKLPVNNKAIDFE